MTTDSAPTTDAARGLFDAPLAVEVAGGVAWIRLNRPLAMNALNHELVDGLDAAIGRAERDDLIGVVVLTGAPPAFCAGADLKQLLGLDGQVDPHQLRVFVTRTAEVIERLAALEKPVIAAVNGLAVAGGLELVLACDVVVAARSARLGDAHANYGLLPGAGGAARLARVVGPTVAKYLAFTGRALPAADLVPLGLVNEVVDDEALEAHAAHLADQIATKSRPGLRHMKRLIDDGLEQPLVTALHLEHLALAEHARSDDLREGLTAFRDKRTPFFGSETSGA